MVAAIETARALGPLRDYSELLLATALLAIGYLGGMMLTSNIWPIGGGFISWFVFAGAITATIFLLTVYYTHRNAAHVVPVFVVVPFAGAALGLPGPSNAGLSESFYAFITFTAVYSGSFGTTGAVSGYLVSTSVSLVRRQSELPPRKLAKYLVLLCVGSTIAAASFAMLWLFGSID